ncbi:MAG: asparaginase [Thermoanaerobacteraceae bacterium]
MKKKIAIIFTGGTISMKIDPRLNAAIPALSGKDILHMVTGIENYADIEMLQFGEYPGPHVTPQIMFNLKKMLENVLLREDISGAVVTHGTDTLEETAYFLDLTLKTQKPVIVTGSMRNSSELGYDGPSNIASSICTAISEQAKGKGVLVVFNNEINAASEVTKTHTLSLDTFKSPDFGPLGIVDNDEAIFYRDILYHDYIPTENIEPRVSLLKTVAGMDDRLFKFLVDSGEKGIVIEGTGRGNVTPKMVEGIKYAISNGTVIVLVSRCSRGRVLDTYGYEGGGKNLTSMGVILGDNLPGQKARIKLMIALGYTNNHDEIREIFERDIYKRRR